MSFALLFLLSLVSAGGGVEIVRSTESGLSARIEFPAPFTVPTTRGRVPMVPGLSLRCREGEPIRPARRLVVPVPPGVEPELSYRVRAAASVPVETFSTRFPRITGRGLETLEIPAPPREGPTEHVRLQALTNLAGTRVALIEIYPAVGEDLSSWASSVELSLRWPTTPGSEEVGNNRLLRLILPDHVPFWPTPRRRRAESPFWGLPWARIAFTVGGPYSVSCEELVQVGCDLEGCDVATLRMLAGPGEMFPDEPGAEHQVNEVSIMVRDVDSDGSFDPQDQVRFLARGLDRWEPSGDSLIRMGHRYASHNVYWLTWGGQPGSRMEERAAAPQGWPQYGPSMARPYWLERDSVREATYETEDGWIWDVLEVGESWERELGLSGASGIGDLELDLLSVSSGYYLVDVRLDDSLVAQRSWNGIRQTTVRVEQVPLYESSTLSVTLAGGDEGSRLGIDHVSGAYGCAGAPLLGSVLYPGIGASGQLTMMLTEVSPEHTAFDLTGFDDPAMLTQTSYHDGELSFSLTVDSTTRILVADETDWMSADSIRPASPGRLVATVDGGDRMIVVPEELYDGVWGLVRILEEQGCEPVVATTREIYDEFNGGLTDPGAIRSAIAWGQDTWEPGLSSVTLVGDGHYDNLGRSTVEPVLVPPYTMLIFGIREGGCCSDDYYVMTHEGDVLPEVPIGRLPVDDLSDLGTVTAKVLAYRSGQSCGEWVNRIILVADDEWGNGMNQSEVTHTVDCESLAEDVTPRYLERRKFYLIEYPWPGGGGHPEKVEARNDFIEDYGRGYGFLTFLGHGSARQITHEKLLRGEDVPSLSNGPRLPLTYWGTCDVGRFDDPGRECIGEDLVTLPSGGAISSIAATRGTFSGGNYNMARNLIDSLYRSEDLTMGQALWTAKVLSSSYSSNDRYYVLMGLPDLGIARPDTGALLFCQGGELRTGERCGFEGTGFPGQGPAFARVDESSTDTSYTTLGGPVIDYLSYGGPIFKGWVSVEGGELGFDCFVPVQARPGSLARATATWVADSPVVNSYLDPLELVEGSPAGNDSTGPSGEMWIRGYREIDRPRVTGELVLEAELEDESGICFLGGEGRQLTLFIDGTGVDVGPQFYYLSGSSTVGRLSYEVQQLSEGEHRFILRSLDGMGNMSLDTLEVFVLQKAGLSVDQALVYPNPGSGRRCFSFNLSGDAYVEVYLFTVTGRRLRTLSSHCSQGYNQIMWDGLDADGDPLASGTYVYSIAASSETASVLGSEARVTGIMAVVRDD
ncbi:hypothetical protein GF402_00605 [Candidatus Fermentibacteria bacterium]|nr:hypothetical protein [Candidatus Fermentibacteria bacterium]